jgi:hypothetical protein
VILRVTVAILGILLMCLYLAWTGGGELAGLGGDNAIYLLTAQHFSPWSAPSEVAQYFARHSQYPPLLPLTIGLVSSWDSPQSVLYVAHASIALTLLFSLVALGVWMRSTAAPASVWIGVPVVFALLPGTYHQALVVNSETLYLAMSACALAGVSLAQARGERRWLLAGAVFVALALLTRTAGVALLAAGVIHMLRQRNLPGAVIMACAVLPIAIWSGWVLPSERESYLDDWVNLSSATDFSHVPARLQLVLTELGSSWRTRLFGDLGNVAFVANVLLTLSAVACVLRAKKGHFDGVYGVIYVAMIIAWGYIWPATISRLLFPLIPILVFQLHWLLGLAAQRVTRPQFSRFSHIALLMVLLVGASPYAASTVARFSQTMHSELAQYRRIGVRFSSAEATASHLLNSHVSMVNVLREVTDYVEPGECIFAIKPSLIGWYANRVSVQPPLERLSDEAFESAINDVSCKYVLGLDWRTPTYAAPWYPLNRLDGRVTPVKIWQLPHQAAPMAVLARRK